MITKGQWKELCDNIRKRRLEDKDIYYGTHRHKIVACFQYRDFILLSDENNTKLTHKDFINQSYKEVKSQFYWIEIHNFNSELN